MKVLVVIDMQNDFVTGSLANPEAEKIIPKVAKLVQDCLVNGYKVYMTKDTHFNNYLDTFEGQRLPIPHCIDRTEGQDIVPELNCYKHTTIYKTKFGSLGLAESLEDRQDTENDPIEEIIICGTATNICVVSNALILRAAFPTIPIKCYSSCCAGTSVEAHNAAIETMRSCMIDIVD